MRYLLLALTIAFIPAACAPRLVVHRPDLLTQVNTIAVAPIHVGKTQKEYSRLYFASFRDEFSKKFSPRFKVIPIGPEDAQQDFTWENAVARAGIDQVDLIVGLLIDDSDQPGRLIEIIKMVRPSNEKILAGSNRLLEPKPDYSFRQEIQALESALKAAK